MRLFNRENQTEKKNTSLHTKVGKAFVCSAFVGILFVFGIWSMVDTDKTVSESENRNLATKPKFTAEAVLDKSYTAEFDEYYADTFPLREEFLAVNRKITKILAGTKGADDIVLVQKGDKDDFAGQSIDYEE